MKARSVYALSWLYVAFSISNFLGLAYLNRQITGGDRVGLGIGFICLWFLLTNERESTQ
jgi:hypothetical protein